MDKLDLNIQEHVRLYQSLWFSDKFPVDNNKFENIVFTERKESVAASIEHMRIRMFSENAFSAAVFIGGMNGIEDEYKMFNTKHHNAVLLPVASTGAAARIVYETLLPQNFRNLRLEKDYAYMSLFQDLLINKI